MTRHVAEPEQLVGELPAFESAAEGIQRLAALYPVSLGDAVRRWRRVDAEKEPQEHADLLAELRRHDEAARAAHLALARDLGDGSEARLRALLAQLHYAEHAAANLRDLRGVLVHTVRVESTGRVSDAGRARVLAAAGALYQALRQAYAEAPDLVLDEATAKRLSVARWPEALGELKLGPPDASNLGDWIGVIDSWMNLAERAFGQLRGAVLGELLATEARVASQLPDSGAALPVTPRRYTTLLDGAERPRDLRPGLWARFLAAQGPVPAGARVVVAGGIVAGVLGLGGGYGDVEVQVVNGLDRTVRVRVGDSSVVLPPFGNATVHHAAAEQVDVSAETEQGELIERFPAPLEHGYVTPLYNVAGAAPLLEMTYTYGDRAPEPSTQPLGSPRWSRRQADVFFGDPPHSVSGKKGQVQTRRVIYSGADAVPGLQLSLLDKETGAVERLAELHLHWDRHDSPVRLAWLRLLRDQPAHAKLLAAALAREPGSIELMRERFDTLPAAELKSLCDELNQRAAAPGATGDAVYLAARCLPDGPKRDAALLAGLQRFPKHGWMAYGAAWAEAGAANWRVALRDYELARTEPTVAPFAAIEVNRLRRLLGEQPLPAEAEQLWPRSRLQTLMGVQVWGASLITQPEAYTKLAAGKPDEAATLDVTYNPHLLRLAAASDGASTDLRKRVAALPGGDGLDEQTYWTALGLADREGWAAPRAPDALRGVEPEQLRQIEAFRAALRSPATLAGADKHLLGLPLELRGQAYSMAAVRLGERTPPAWRDGAKRLLMSHERPYFN